MNENQQQVPFNTILFSDGRILTEHEKQTVLENTNYTSQAPSRDQAVDYCKLRDVVAEPFVFSNSSQTTDNIRSSRTQKNLNFHFILPSVRFGFLIFFIL